MFRVGLVEEIFEMDKRRTGLHMKLFFGFQVGCDDEDIWDKICSFGTAFDVTEGDWTMEYNQVQRCVDGTRAERIFRNESVHHYETKIDHNVGFYKTFGREQWNLLRRDPSSLNEVELDAYQELQIKDKMHLCVNLDIFS